MRNIILLLLVAFSGCAYPIVPSDSIGFVEPVVSEDIEVGGNYWVSWEEEIRRVQTPSEARAYLELCMKYSDKYDRSTSFRLNHLDGKGKCVDCAVCAAALLSDNGYPALMLVMGQPFYKLNHAVFIYRERDGFRMLGNQIVIHAYETVEEMVVDFSKKYGRSYKSYFVVDLDLMYPNKEWIFGEKALFDRFYFWQKRERVGGK